MAIRTLSYLKSRFETGDKPDRQDYIDLFDTLSQSEGNRIIYGDGAPVPTIGSDGDSYIDKQNGGPGEGNFYQKTGSTWTLQFNTLGQSGTVGPQGPAGPQGPQGEPFQIDETDDMDATKLADIQANSGATSSNPYWLVVQNDTRADQTQPTALNGDKTGHLISWNGSVWFDNGQFTGVAGPQGPQGPQGVQGPAGADGADGVDGTNGTNGVDGADGSPWDGFRGEYNPAVTYNDTDVVSYQGSSYICRTDGTLGVTPDESASEWDYLAKAGDLSSASATFRALSSGSTFASQTEVLSLSTATSDAREYDDEGVLVPNADNFTAPRESEYIFYVWLRPSEWSGIVDGDYNLIVKYQEFQSSSWTTFDEILELNYTVVGGLIRGANRGGTIAYKVKLPEGRRVRFEITCNASNPGQVLYLYQISGNEVLGGAGGGGGVQSVTGNDNIIVDNTDPENPVVKSDLTQYPFDPQTTAPSRSKGKVWFDDNKESLMMYGDNAQDLQIGHQRLLQIYNNTGSTIVKGTVLYVSSGFDNNGVFICEVDRARSNSQNTCCTLCVAYEDVLDQNVGQAVKGGALEMDLTNFTTGHTLFVDASVAGLMTDVEPAYPNLSAKIGRVIEGGVNGVLYVDPDTDAQYSLTGGPSQFPASIQLSFIGSRQTSDAALYKAKASGALPTIEDTLQQAMFDNSQCEPMASDGGKIRKISVALAQCAVGGGSKASTVNLKLKIYNIRNQTDGGPSLVSTVSIPLSDKADIGVNTQLTGGKSIVKGSTVVDIATTQGELYGFLLSLTASNNSTINAVKNAIVSITWY